MVWIVDIASVLIHKGSFLPLNMLLGLFHRAYIEEAPKLELKSLPSHLKYFFLGDDDNLTVIFSTGLSDL